MWVFFFLLFIHSSWYSPSFPVRNGPWFWRCAKQNINRTPSHITPTVPTVPTSWGRRFLPSTWPIWRRATAVGSPHEGPPCHHTRACPLEGPPGAPYVAPSVGPSETTLAGPHTMTNHLYLVPMKPQFQGAPVTHSPRALPTADPQPSTPPCPLNHPPTPGALQPPAPSSFLPPGTMLSPTSTRILPLSLPRGSFLINSAPSGVMIVNQPRAAGTMRVLAVPLGPLLATM